MGRNSARLLLWSALAGRAKRSARRLSRLAYTSPRPAAGNVATRCCEQRCRKRPRNSEAFELSFRETAGPVSPGTRVVRGAALALWCGPPEAGPDSGAADVGRTALGRA